ncbi:MAG: fructosamine kinase family protein [Kofleriaceae bacterium]
MEDERAPPGRGGDPPRSWRHELGDALGAEVTVAAPVSGGDINEAYRARLADGRVVFVKAHAAAPPGMFAAEARGLAWLAGGALQVPRVLAVGESYLALEWLELARGGDGFEARLGRELAQLHLRDPGAFGLDHDNYLATLPQHNQPDAGVLTWPELFVERRLRPFAAIAGARGRLPSVERELDELRRREDRFGPPEPPARLHGDLWWGNVAAAGGRPVVFDPAVVGGHREVDLAMLAWAGGLPEPLVAAYHEVYPLAPGWRARLALWQLLPLFSHAALFGGGYGAQARRGLTAALR